MPRETAAVRILAGDKEPARLASTANLALAGLLTVDGVVTVAGDRVLVKDQTDATENGIYTASEGTWRRASDSSSSRLLIAGMKVAIQEGTAHGGDVWVLATDRPDIGDDDIEWTFYLSTDTVADIQQAAEDLAAAADDILATAWAATNAADFASLAAAELVSIPVGMTYLRTAGYAAAGDGGGALYKKVVSLLSAICGFQSADGAYWQICERILRPEMFSATANTTAIQRAIDAAYLLNIGGEIRLANRNYRAVKQGSNAWCLNLYGNVSLVGEAPGIKDGSTAGTGSIISWGSDINSSTDIVLWNGSAYDTMISGIQFMPDGFTATVGFIVGPFYGKDVINVNGVGRGMIRDNMIGPANGYSIHFSAAINDWPAGIVDNNFIFGGVLALGILDNCSFTNNTCNGIKCAFDITVTPGAGNTLIAHNNGIAAGGAVFLHNGPTVKILNNYFELPETFTGGNGYYYNLNGDVGEITHCEFKGNTCSSLVSSGLVGLVYVDNTNYTDFDNNVLSSTGATIVGINISADNLNPYLGKVACSGVTPTGAGVTRPGYNVSSPLTVLPFEYDIPLTLLNGWVAAAEVPAVRRERNGICHLSGAMTTGTITAGTIIFNLPDGFRPATNVIRVCPTTTGTVTLLITSGGPVSFLGSGASATITGIGCSFPAATTE